MYNSLKDILHNENITLEDIAALAPDNIIGTVEDKAAYVTELMLNKQVTKVDKVIQVAEQLGICIDCKKQQLGFDVFHEGDTEMITFISEDSTFPLYNLMYTLHVHIPELKYIIKCLDGIGNLHKRIMSVDTRVCYILIDAGVTYDVLWRALEAIHAANCNKKLLFQQYCYEDVLLSGIDNSLYAKYVQTANIAYQFKTIKRYIHFDVKSLEHAVEQQIATVTAGTPYEYVHGNSSNMSLLQLTDTPASYYRFLLQSISEYLCGRPCENAMVKGVR